MNQRLRIRSRSPVEYFLPGGEARARARNSGARELSRLPRPKKLRAQGVPSGVVSRMVEPSVGSARTGRGALGVAFRLHDHAVKRSRGHKPSVQHADMAQGVSRVRAAMPAEAT